MVANMDYVDRMMGRNAASRFSPETLLKFTDLAPPVQKHLEKVYLTLTLALLAAAAGVYTNILIGIGGFVGIIGFVVFSVWLAATPSVAQTLNKRYALLGGAAFSQGLTIGPLVDAAVQVDAGIVATAFLATSAVFACFSGAALLSRRRSWLYLGGTLSSAISVFMMMRFATWMFGGQALAFQAQLYGGLLVFLGYVLFDTQVIVEKAYAGDTDHIKHALDLFVDFAAIFVRLLIILLKSQANSRREDDKRRKRR